MPCPTALQTASGTWAECASATLGAGATTAGQVPAFSLSSSLNAPFPASPAGSTSRAPVVTAHGGVCQLPLLYHGMQVRLERAGPQRRAPWADLLRSSRTRLQPPHYTSSLCCPQVDGCINIDAQYLCWGQDSHAWEACPADLMQQQPEPGALGVSAAAAALPVVHARLRATTSGDSCRLPTVYQVRRPSGTAGSWGWRRCLRAAAVPERSS